MRTRSMFAVAAVVALLLSLAVVGTASAATQPFPAVSTAGAVAFEDQGTVGYAVFAARATGPAMPGEMHQPAAGFLFYKDRTGLTFAASVMHIHAHMANEVHFGGTITRASDPALVGRFAHFVAVDGGSPGSKGDMFSVHITEMGVHHEHGDPVPVLWGNLVVRASAMM